MAKKIDKDYLFKVAVRMIGDEMCFNNIQMNRSMNILTTVFSNIDCISTEDMLLTDKYNNSIIIKNFNGCKKMSGVKDSSIKQYNWTISAFLRFCNNNQLTTKLPNDVKLITEGSGANTKYYVQLGADTASKKQLGDVYHTKAVTVGGGTTSYTIPQTDTVDGKQCDYVGLVNLSSTRQLAYDANDFVDFSITKTSISFRSRGSTLSWTLTLLYRER